MLPLEGLLVLDLTRLMPGAVATQTLAAQGARVIKIEQPGEGDYARQAYTEVFAATNRGKESLVLDLKDEDHRNALRLLAMDADVLVEGFRPGVMHRFGLDYPLLRGLNPRLIYVALTGYGQRGEYAQLAGHDINYMAMAGVLNEIGTAESPVIPGIQIADLAGGSMQVVNGILLALQARHRTGEGQLVDVSMTAGAASLLTLPLATGQPAGQRQGAALLTGRYACYNLYRAAGGTFVAVGALEPKFWRALCEALGRTEWIADQFTDGARQQEIKQQLAERFLEKPAETWFAELRHLDCCVTPVRGLPPPQAFPDLAPPPALGEHNQRLKEEFGLPIS